MTCGDAFCIFSRKIILNLIANQVHNGSFEGWVTKKSVVYRESVKTEGEALTFRVICKLVEGSALKHKHRDTGYSSLLGVSQRHA